jgi:hypothetical protein
MRLIEYRVYRIIRETTSFDGFVSAMDSVFDRLPDEPCYMMDYPHLRWLTKHQTKENGVGYDLQTRLYGGEFSLVVWENDIPYLERPIFRIPLPDSLGFATWPETNKLVTLAIKL